MSLQVGFCVRINLTGFKDLSTHYYQLSKTLKVGTYEDTEKSKKFEAYNTRYCTNTWRFARNEASNLCFRQTFYLYKGWKPLFNTEKSASKTCWIYWQIQVSHFTFATINSWKSFTTNDKINSNKLHRFYSSWKSLSILPYKLDVFRLRKTDWMYL